MQTHELIHQAGHDIVAVRTGDPHEWDQAFFALGENMVNDGASNRTRLAFGWFDVHEQAGACIDFNNRTALLVQRARDVLSHQINTCDVQADCFRCKACNMRHIRVDVVGAVKGDVSIALNQCLDTDRHDAVGFKALAFKLKPGSRVNPYRVKRLLFAPTATRV